MAVFAPSVTGEALGLAASLACGAMVGIERGWRLRAIREGGRVAGVRTFTLLGLLGGLAAVTASRVSPLLAAATGAAVLGGLTYAYWHDQSQRDATSFVAALATFLLGVLAASGAPGLAVAAAAITVLILATRQQSHHLLRHLNRQDIHAFARFAVVTGAVLPFLPNRPMGPLDAWNPFELWLVVVLVSAFSFAGYIANRTVGARRGVLASALIGGAYSSTAVTAALSQRLSAGEQGPFAAGILLASGVMYIRVIILVAILSPSTLPAFLLAIGPAAAVGVLIALVAWLRSPLPAGKSEATVPGNPIEIGPALLFLAVVAFAAVGARWAQLEFGERGIATTLFLTGILDVDAAIITLSHLPAATIDRATAAIALAGTVIANMSVKMLVVGLTARQQGTSALVGLGASLAVLVASVAWRLMTR